MDGTIEVRLTAPQMKLINSITVIPKDLGKTIKQAAKKAKGTKLEISFSDLDQLAGWLATEANREETARRKRSLDRLYDVVQTALWDFEDWWLSERESASPFQQEPVTAFGQKPSVEPPHTRRR